MNSETPETEMSPPRGGRMPRGSLSPKQVARAIGVSEASLKRWCDKGLLLAVKTAGGHRRLQVSSVVQFLRNTGHELIRPEVLGLPPTSGSTDWTLDRGAERMFAALSAGDDELVQQLTVDLYLAGFSACEICDRVFARVFHDIGRGWEHGALQVYEERRAGELCVRAIHRMEQLIPPPAPDAPRAFGATLEHDPYVIPTKMAALVLREAGWQASSYGIGIPADTLCTALEREKPRLFWLSVSAIGEQAEFLAGYQRIYETAARLGISLAVGGRVLVPELRKEMKYACYCDNMGHLTTFAASIHATPGPVAATEGAP